MPCPPFKVSPPITSRPLTSPLQGPTWGRAQDKAPVRPLRGPWDKYSSQEVEETNSTKPQESPPGDEARSGQVAYTYTPSTAEDRGQHRLGYFFLSEFEVDVF